RVVPELVLAADALGDQVVAHPERSGHLPHRGPVVAPLGEGPEGGVEDRLGRDRGRIVGRGTAPTPWAHRSSSTVTGRRLPAAPPGGWVLDRTTVRSYGAVVRFREVPAWC